MNNTIMTNTSASIDRSSAPVLSVADSQAGDAIGQINELMVNLGQLFGKMRDLLRQYNQVQQGNAFKMQLKSFETRLSGIEKDFQAKDAQAWSQIISGGVQVLGGAVSTFGASKGTGEALSWLSHSGEVTKGAGAVIEGTASCAWVNPGMRDSQKEQAIAEFQHGFADQLLKRAEETLEKALRLSIDMREFMSSLTQAHDRLASSVRHQ
ncbi:MAG: hypothetical protein JHC61_05325 [Burkholderiaceae bacterium]|nr:hypothetical protein [Burkholderiaceae bacterium]